MGTYTTIHETTQRAQSPVFPLPPWENCAKLPPLCVLLMCYCGAVTVLCWSFDVVLCCSVLCCSCATPAQHSIFCLIHCVIVQLDTSEPWAALRWESVCSNKLFHFVRTYTSCTHTSTHTAAHSACSMHSEHSTHSAHLAHAVTHMQSAQHKKHM